MSSWVSLSHDCAVLPFFGVDRPRPGHKRVQSLSQPLLSHVTGMIITLDSLCVLVDRNIENEEHGAALKLEGKSSVLNTDPPSAHQTLGGAPSWEEAHLRWGKDSRAWEL